MDFYQLCFGFCALLTGGLFYSSRSDSQQSAHSPEFKAFQKTYLIAYLFAFAGDWLQGPHVYALYSSYGYSQADIATLFVAGFGSSMIFGTFIGSLADKMGRKKAATLYCLIYIGSCLTKHFANYWMLMLGRFLGGIATSLVYSVFESWMVSEHSARGFDEDWMKDTFSKAMLGNSLVAILSGIVAQYVAGIAQLHPLSDGSSMYVGGSTAPFDVALFFLLLCLFQITTTWNENFGQSKSADDVGISFRALEQAVQTIKNDKKTLLIGSISSLFEGSMFTFVFMWTPMLQELSVTNKDELPFGLIFATFMLCCMSGSSLFGILSNRMKTDRIAFLMLCASGASLAMGAVNSSLELVYLGFLVFEGCVGIYWPTMGTMKGMYVPDGQRAAIYNVFRFPLNGIVLFVLKMNMSSSQKIASICIMLASAAYLQTLLCKAIAQTPKSTGTDTELEQMEEGSNDATE